MNEVLDAPVLIVGAGPVGLGLAIDLARRGMRCTLIDARDGSVSIPKMSQVSMRSMEICRRWGVAEEVEAVAWPPDYPQDVVYVTTLMGYELARTKVAPYARTPEKAVTPHGNCHCPQIYFDPILRRHAERDPLITLRYETELESFVDRGDHVEAHLIERRGRRSAPLRSRYLVGCDGANSKVRSVLDVPFLGEGRLSSSISIFFRSPELISLHDKGWARFYRLVDGTGHWGDLVGIDGKELWRLTVLDLQGSSPQDVDVSATLERMAGGPFPYEVISTLPWDRRDFVAGTYRVGNAFLAGDAAHVLSPTGGVGMNTGIGDAYDLSWKLAATLQGWGGETLLDSYDTERRPVAHTNVAASTNYFRRLRSVFPTGLALDEDTMRGEEAREAFTEAFAEVRKRNIFHISEQVRLGYCYEPSPIVVADGTAAPEISSMNYIPNARPGTRAPHLYLDDGRSLLDVFGDGFVLLRIGSAPPACDALTAVAQDLGMPLNVFAIADPVALEIYAQPLVLVRPDGHVAWRGASLPSDVRTLLDTVRGGPARQSDRPPPGRTALTPGPGR